MKWIAQVSMGGSQATLLSDEHGILSLSVSDENDDTAEMGLGPDECAALVNAMRLQGLITEVQK